MQRHQAIEGALDAGAKTVLRGGRVTVAEHFEASPIVILEHRQREPRKRVLAQIAGDVPDTDAIPRRTRPRRLPTLPRAPSLSLPRMRERAGRGRPAKTLRIIARHG